MGAPQLISGRPALCQAPAAPVVAGIDFAGRLNVPEEVLRGVLKLKPGESFAPSRMEADRKALLALGFFRSVTATQRTEDGQTQVSFRLVEWPRVLHIRVRGNTLVDQQAIREVISTQVGQVLRAPQLQDDVRAIERLYRERGYVARLAQSLLEDATRTGILHFDILELRIEDVQIEGGTRELQERARHAIEEWPPHFYRPEAVALDQRRLLKVRGIESAVARVETVAPGRVRIRWLLNAPPPGPEPVTK